MKTNTSTGLTVADLRRATELKEAIDRANADHQANIERLESELAGLLGGTASAPSGKVRQTGTGTVGKGENFTASGRPRNAMKMRDAIAKVVSRKPQTLNEIVEGLNKIGYQFAAARPANSVGAFLYGRHGKKDFRNREGKFEFIGKK